MEKKIYEPILENEMPLTPAGINIYSTIAKWAKFISIVGFVFIGLSAIMSIVMAATMSGVNEYMEMNNQGYYYRAGTFGWGAAIIWIIILAVYFIPTLFLFKFATGINKAIDSNYSHTIYKSLDFLKKHYMFIGILTIIGLVLFIIGFIAMIVGISSMM